MKIKILAQNVAVLKLFNGMSALSLLIIRSPTDYNRDISKQEIKKKNLHRFASTTRTHTIIK
jgi:hypothetical protein